MAPIKCRVLMRYLSYVRALQLEDQRTPIHLECSQRESHARKQAMHYQSTSKHCT